MSKIKTTAEAIKEDSIAKDPEDSKTKEDNVRRAKEALKEGLKIVTAEEEKKTLIKAKAQIKNNIEQKKKALKLLSNPRLLYKIKRQFEKLGIAGEVRNCLMIYLTLTSRMMDRPISVVPKGESSSGKSYMISLVLKLLPKNAYVEMTAATAQSFYHAGKNDFKHKIIVVYERKGSESSDYSIRSFQSEGNLKLQITVKDKKTGNFKVKRKEVSGPIGFLTTTTDPQIHDENETRVFSLYTNESTKQTARIFKASSAGYKGVNSISNLRLKKFKKLQRLLKTYKVLIPYVDDLASTFPLKPVRVRRDFPRFLTLISVITLLHQCQREKRIINRKEYLVSSLADYYIAKIIAERMLKQTIFEIAPKTKQIIKVAKKIIDLKIKKQLLNSKSGISTMAGSNPTFSIRELAERLEWGYKTTYKWFKPALEKTYFTMEEMQRGRQGATYIINRMKANQIILPEVNDMIKKYPLNRERIYNPITGEYLDLGKK